MKMLKKASIAMLIVLGLSLVFPNTASAQIPSGTFNINFSPSGFCDGMQLTRSGRSLVGVPTGCAAGLGFNVGETFGANSLSPLTQQPVAVISGELSYTSSCPLFWNFNFITKKFANYYTCDGTTFTTLNSGKSFAFGPPPALATGSGKGAAAR